MDNAKSQLIDRLKTANSILVTVSRNPSVDQLAACLGLTLLINKLEKHGSAVFSGQIPSTIEFLKPEQTIEKNADSLRDFIIALDKDKADKLRYKVEDQVVRIFITPYRTSLSEKDLEFSQGDFNVELVIALGVKQQEDLDQTIIAHGRILHDATVACITTADQSNLGNIIWREPTASSLCELVTDLAANLGENLIDEQIATALLTGIIAETERFSNEKTTPQTMSVSARLMAAGANQQLVATNLNESKTIVPAAGKQASTGTNSAHTNDGTLNIAHDVDDLSLATLPPPTDLPDEPTSGSSDSPKIVVKPPELGGTLTANSVPEPYDPSTDPLSNTLMPSSEASTTASPILSRQSTEPTFTPPPPSWTPPNPPPSVNTQQSNQITQDSKDETITDLEKAVDSPHLKTSDVKDAREQVESVLLDSPDLPEKRKDLNAEPLSGLFHNNDTNPPAQLSEMEQLKKGTGLDPSLFSEPPKDDDNQPPPAPPYPPPINP